MFFFKTIRISYVVRMTHKVLSHKYLNEDIISFKRDWSMS